MAILYKLNVLASANTEQEPECFFENSFFNTVPERTG